MTGARALSWRRTLIVFGLVVPTFAALLVASGAAESSKAAQVTTVHVLFQTGGDAIGPKKGLAKFERQNPDIKVQIEEVPPETLYQKLVTNFVSGSAKYDVVEFYPTWMGDFVSGGFLENLDPYFAKYAKQVKVGDYLESGTQNNRNKIGGHWYGVPFDNDLMVFYYRKDLFEKPQNRTAFRAKYGYALAAPRTWNQVLDIARFFKSQGEVAGFSTVAARTWWAVGYWENLYGSYGGTLQKGSKANLDRGAFNKANAMWLKLLATAPEGVENFGYTESRAAIVEGKTAMSLQWATTAITDPKGLAPGVRLGVAVMPGSIRNGKLYRTPALPVGKTLAIAKNSKNKDAAFRVAQWMSSPEMQAVETLSNSGIDPNRASVFAMPAVKKAWATMIPAVKATLKIGVPDLNVKNSKKYYDSLIAELSAVWTKQVTSDKAYDRIIANWKSVR